MTPERSRSQAYGRVIHTLTEIGPSKLQPDEADLLREAADQLLFTDGIADADEALASAEILLDALVMADRWIGQTARNLMTDLRDCGPVLQNA